MTSKRIKRTGRSRSVRIFSGLGTAMAVTVMAVPVPAHAATPFAASASSFAPATNGQGVAEFYAERFNRPLWFGEQGRQAEVLLELLETSSIDGLDPRKYRVSTLAKAVRTARRGDPRAVRKAERMLSEALVAYARDLRRPTSGGIHYVDSDARPVAMPARALLQAADQAPSLEKFIAEMGWMHPLYGQLRHSLSLGSYGEAERKRIALNLERVRELPGPVGKHILVNAAAQRLFMYEDGQVVDSMRVVVGKPIYPTPMMAASIRFTSLNPYWYVPPDLAAERIAPGVLKSGMNYLKVRGYQVVSSFEGEPEILDPATVDWQSVADGRTEVLIRQLPGPGNSMGRMKFMFPNKFGVYLHDTPEKELLEEASRLFSGGCVRLEDASRLSEWLYGERLKPQGKAAEQVVPMPQTVPVYISYLTAVPSSGFKLAFYDDIYGRDAQRLAQSQATRSIASR